MRFPWTRSREGKATARRAPLVFRRITHRLARIVRETPPPPPLHLPEVHIYETEKDITIRVETRDLEPRDFKLRLSGNALTLRGLVKEVAPEPAEQAVRVRPYRRSILLPAAIDRTGITARYKGRLIRIHIPKRPVESAPAGLAKAG
jgi:HSP20 family molecular chaperone IbpA